MKRVAKYHLAITTEPQTVHLPRGWAGLGVAYVGAFDSFITLYALVTLTEPEVRVRFRVVPAGAAFPEADEFPLAQGFALIRGEAYHVFMEMPNDDD